MPRSDQEMLTARTRTLQWGPRKGLGLTDTKETSSMGLGGPSGAGEGRDGYTRELKLEVPTGSLEERAQSVRRNWSGQ